MGSFSNRGSAPTKAVDAGSPGGIEQSFMLNLSDEELEEQIESGAYQWSVDDKKSLYWASGHVADTVIPGLYRVDYRDRIGVCLDKQIISTDELLPLPDSDGAKIIEEIEKFWKLKKEFKKRGLLHKRGILMYGDPGCGKTCTIQLLIKKLIEMGGIAVYPHEEPKITAQALQLIRRIQPKIPIILVMEDFEVQIMKPQHENEWLSILDGESQVDNIVFLSTTNYIEKLDKRFVDRPSRFDKLVLVKMPNADARRMYLKKKEPSLSGEELEEWVEKTHGFGIAHLKELIVAVKVLGEGLEDTVKRMEDMRERNHNSDENLKGTKKEKTKIGF